MVAVAFTALERLQSRFMEATSPVPMTEVYARFGGEPVSPKEFAALTEYLLPSEGEGEG